MYRRTHRLDHAIGAYGSGLAVHVCSERVHAVQNPLPSASPAIDTFENLQPEISVFRILEFQSYAETLGLRLERLGKGRSCSFSISFLGIGLP